MNIYPFGNRLLSIRKERRLSQSELGNLIGVSKKIISKWENGVAKPNVDMMLKLALALEVTAVDCQP